MSNTYPCKVWILRISVVLRGTKTGFVRVFQLDAEKNTPLTAAKQIELV